MDKNKVVNGEKEQVLEALRLLSQLVDKSDGLSGVDCLRERQTTTRFSAGTVTKYKIGFSLYMRGGRG